MARLNEAPPQIESVEALKRRFIRQNRDLARINTSQSLRIRSLEIEQSRLQAENLCLREEIIQLRKQVINNLDNPQLSDLARIKTDLEQQLTSICGAVAELGRFKRTEEEPLRQPDPSSWRPAVPNLRLAGQELRMPSIVEDKMYPRRTLGAEDIRALRLSDQSTDSPDLGPPPVARFDCSDPIKFDRDAMEASRRGDDMPVEIPAELAMNLETRRKRRETTLRLAESTNGDSEQEEAVTLFAQRASTKRKLGVREQEEPVISSAAEPFTFTRRTASIPNIVDAQPGKLPISPEKPESTIGNKDRKVLGEKNVNASPRKVVVGKKPTGTLSKASVDTANARARRPKTTQIPVIPVKDTSDAAPAIVDILPPRTPSAAALFSPTLSEPSSITHDPTDGPRNAVTDANLEGIRRPSRRARAVTSYAEPSLNTKMRRPSVAMVDAVVIPKATSQAPRTVKREEDEDGNEAWKSLASAAMEPVSPLGERAHRTAAGTAVAALSMPRRAGTGELPLRPTSTTGRRASVSSRRHSSVITSAEALEALSSSPARGGEAEQVTVVAKAPPVLPPALKVEARAARRRSMLV